MSLFFYTSSFFFPKTKIICSSFFDVRSCEDHLRCVHSFLFVHTIFFIIYNESVFAQHIHIFLTSIYIYFIIYNESVFAQHIPVTRNLIFFAAAAFRSIVMLKLLSSRFIEAFVRICKVCVSIKKFLSSFVIHKIAFGNYVRTISYPRNKRIIKSVSIFFIFEIEFNSIKFTAGIRSILQFYCFYFCSCNFTIITEC